MCQSKTVKHPQVSPFISIAFNIPQIELLSKSSLAFKLLWASLSVLFAHALNRTLHPAQRESHYEPFIDVSVELWGFTSETSHDIPADPVLTHWHWRNVGDGGRQHLLQIWGPVKLQRLSPSCSRSVSRWQLSGEMLGRVSLRPEGWWMEELHRRTTQLGCMTAIRPNVGYVTV